MHGESALPDCFGALSTQTVTPAKPAGFWSDGVLFLRCNPEPSGTRAGWQDARPTVKADAGPRRGNGGLTTAETARTSDSVRMEVSPVAPNLIALEPL
jgi:hypothetical protein